MKSVCSPATLNSTGRTLEGRESKKEKGIGIFHIHEEVKEG